MMRSQYQSQYQSQSQSQHRSSSNSTRVILVRHGRSTFNEQGLYQGSSDRAVLTERGRETAYQVGSYLKSEPVHLVYTSPLKRVLQTAEAMLSGMESDRTLKLVQHHPDLREIDMHAWEGQPFKRVQESFAADYQCWKERPHEFQMERVVSPTHTKSSLATIAQTQCFPVLDLYDRAQQFWQEILPPENPVRELDREPTGLPNKTILIISHGGTNRALMSTALGIAPSQFHQMQQSNCGISILNFPTGHLSSGRLETLNLTTPLGETLPKLKEGKQGLRLLLLPIDNGSIDRATSANLQPVINLLSSVNLDFCLTCTSGIDSAISQLLSQHPTTVQLHCQRDRSLPTWQRIITANANHPAQLMTGLVIASIAEVQQMIGEAIGLSSTQYGKLSLQSGALSVLHYPTANQPPILQAVNYL